MSRQRQSAISDPKITRKSAPITPNVHKSEKMKQSKTVKSKKSGKLTGLVNKYEAKTKLKTINNPYEE